MKRHGFVTIFLWFLIIQVIPALGYILRGNIIFALPSILTSIGGILLLKWKFSGFVIHCIACLLMVFINIGYAGLDISVAMIACVIGIGIVYLVLKIRKDDISAWSHLIGEFDKDRGNEESKSISTIPDFREDAFYRVKEETSLNDSLSTKPKKIRSLQQDEQVKIKAIQDRSEFNGLWALVETESKDEGWCFFSMLEEETERSAE